MLRTTSFKVLAATGLGTVSFVALYGLSSVLSDAAAAAAWNEFPSVFEYVGLFTSAFPLAAMFVLPGAVATLISRVRAPWIGCIAGVLGAAVVETVRSGGLNAIVAQSAKALLGKAVGTFAFGLTNVVGALAVLWWLSMRTPSNQPLHPDALTRAGERRR